MVIGLVGHGTGATEGLLWLQEWTGGEDKMRGILLPAECLLASQGLCFLKLVN
jgi:hypothetical protein